MFGFETCKPHASYWLRHNSWYVRFTSDATVPAKIFYRTKRSDQIACVVVVTVAAKSLVHTPEPEDLMREALWGLINFDRHAC